MNLRLHPPQRPVEFLHDGARLSAEQGEPLAHSLIACERLVLARSPKLHRPRGPYCLRAACDGCLVRVDGVPNVMACRHRVSGGEVVETQNVLGSREIDLLQATDFLFPEGFDHHRLFAGVRGVSKVVGLLARRIAGLGLLPAEARATQAATELAGDVLIVGGGGAGLAAAAALGARATLVDDGMQLGGALSLCEPARARDLVAAAQQSGAVLEPAMAALGVYPQERGGPPTVLLANENGACIARPRLLLLATGAHERPPPFPGNDLPGIFTARAGLTLLRSGVAPGRRVAVVGAGPFAALAASLCGERLVERVLQPSAVLAAKGSVTLQELTLRTGNEKTRALAVDALLFDGPLNPALELALQAGAQARFEAGRGYVPQLAADLQVAPYTYLVGRASGDAGDPVARGEALGRALAARLSAR